MSATPTDPADPPAPGRRERRKQQTRDDLYDAALALFAERPYDEVSVEDICERAGVGRATFFRFYGTKSGLLVEFHRRLADKARSVVTDAGAATAAEALHLVRTTMATEWLEGGPLLRDMTREYLRTVNLAAGSTFGQPDLIELVAEIVAGGQERGELRDELAPDFVAWTVITMLSGAAVRYRRASFDGPSAAALDVVLRGLDTTGG